MVWSLVIQVLPQVSSSTNDLCAYTLTMLIIDLLCISCCFFFYVLVHVFANNLLGKLHTRGHNILNHTLAKSFPHWWPLHQPQPGMCDWFLLPTDYCYSPLPYMQLKIFAGQ